ncbi:MAG: hypothetical protein JRH10_18420 [Deltaproteobacteria bacterium]|nr:hypothetical protein [Deltaproteobacteria bacterium]
MSCPTLAPAAAPCRPARRSRRLALWAALLLGSAACASDSSNDDTRATHEALARSLVWLERHRPEPGSKLGNHVLDAWAWERFARLHPDATVRARARSEARSRLAALEADAEPDFVALSYWATALRCRAALGLDPDPLRSRMQAADLERLLRESSPTTALWSAELLRFSGVELTLPARTTLLSSAAVDPDWAPSHRDAVAIYHELAAASDFGRESVRGFSAEEIAFARRAHPVLFSVVRGEGRTDAAAEILISGAILGQRDEPWFADGIVWLRTRQREDGSYMRAGQRPDPPADARRHGIVTASWALLESLQEEDRR